jgi:hypothetical protein
MRHALIVVVKLINCNFMKKIVPPVNAAIIDKAAAPLDGRRKTIAQNP